MIEYQRMKHASVERKATVDGSKTDLTTPGSNVQTPRGQPGDRPEAPSGIKKADPSGHSHGTDQKNADLTKANRTSGSPTA